MTVTAADKDLVFAFFSPPPDTPKQAAKHWIEVFKRERDHALLHGPAQWAAHVAMWHDRDLSDREAEISFHQTRTAVVAVGVVYRRMSHEWLTQRGLETFEDSGSLTDPEPDADGYVDERADHAKKAVAMVAGQCGCGHACGKVVVGLYDQSGIIFAMGSLHYSQMREFSTELLTECDEAEKHSNGAKETRQ